MPEVLFVNFKYLEEKENNTAFAWPYNPVFVDTVSHWLKKFLRTTGIDTTIRTRHTTRTASSSKSKKVRLILPEILKKDSG